MSIDFTETITYEYKHWQLQAEDAFDIVVRLTVEHKGVRQHFEARGHASHTTVDQLRGKVMRLIHTHDIEWGDE